jgi:tRNA threonylcarbamoyladenosine biosynthesis protein TsaB
LLASLEVSTRLCSVALFDLEKNVPIGEMLLSQDQESSVTLLPGLEKLLKEKDLKPTDITALAVAVGPGSFTGIRVGIATAEGFSIPHQLPVYGVSTLDGLAENLRWAGRFGEGLCLVDASRGECFVGRYRIEADGFHEIEPAAIRTLTQIGELLQSKKWVIGPGALKYENELKKIDGQAQWVEAALHVPSAMSLARIAHGRWKTDERPSLEDLKPLYLRIPSVDEKKP